MMHPDFARLLTAVLDALDNEGHRVRKIAANALRAEAAMIEAEKLRPIHIETRPNEVTL